MLSKFADKILAIDKDVFNTIQSIGGVSEDEMFRAFNMGIGMIFIINKEDVGAVSSALKDITTPCKIGEIVAGNGEVKYGAKRGTRKDKRFAKDSG